jgi:glycosyltransferase involved in cell wall biosynthesis
MLSASKCNDSLLDAWLAGFADRADCQLVFVGQAANPAWEKVLKDRAKAAGARNVLITGFADPETYRHWLASTDVAVQLRCQSRGETSAAVLDCFAWGLPTIVNAHGSLAELPPESAAMLEDQFSIGELTNAIGVLIGSSAARSALGRAGKEYLRRAHNPVQVAQQYFQAIEAFHKRSSRRVLEGAVEKLRDLDVGRAPTDIDCDATALGLSTLLGSPSPQAQLLLDVSELVRTDARSGIQRVVRSVLQELLSRTDLDWRVEPVYTTGDGTYRYARKFTCEFLGCPDTTLEDDLIDVGTGDVFIGLDLAPTGVPAALGLFRSLKARGVKLVFVLYDMLPLAHPEWFPPNASDILDPWYRTVAAVADRVVAISHSVADDFAAWLPSTGRQAPLELSWFHLGADVHASVPSRGMSIEDNVRLNKLIQKGNMVLMVGTIEPRKGHDQALEAFATLRARGVDAELVIVGKQGWCVEALIERLVTETASGLGITWFSSASDELLDQLYGSADLLLVASRGEGFGLPIVEAAMRGVTVLARDIPVFREVGGQGIVYFSGDTADDLANSIERTLALVHSGQQPDQASIAVNSWAVSAARFLDAAIGKMSYRTWCSD